MDLRGSTVYRSVQLRKITQKERFKFILGIYYSSDLVHPRTEFPINNSQHTSDSFLVAGPGIIQEHVVRTSGNAD